MSDPDRRDPVVAEKESVMRAGKPVGKAFLTAAVLVVLTLSLGGTSASKGVDRSATYEQLKLFTDVLSIIQNQYVDETEPREVIYGAVRGMLRALDPHSSFMDPESYREMQVETSGSFGGLGIEITIRDDVLTVVAPIDGTPAWRAGIQPGDRIVKIEGLATKDMSLADAVKKMRGPKGTKVTITVVREGTKEPFDVALMREVIQVQSIKAQELEPGIGYIRIRQFQERTAPDLVAAVEKFDKGGKLAGPHRGRPVQPGRAPLGGRGGLRGVPRRRQADRLHRGAGAEPEHALHRAREARDHGRPAGGARQPGLGVGVGDRGGGDPGSRPRRGHRPADLRQGVGADDHPARGRLGAPAHHRALLHAEGPLHPRQGHHAGHRDRPARRTRRRSSRARRPCPRRSR